MYVPDDLAEALDADASARSAFDALPPSHRREHIRWIEEAKKGETRRARIQRTLARLATGR